MLFVGVPVMLLFVNVHLKMCLLSMLRLLCGLSTCYFSRVNSFAVDVAAAAADVVVLFLSITVVCYLS